MARQVFISHASPDAGLALRLCEGLEARGVACWLAPRDVPFTGTYGPSIGEGVRECEVFLIVVTPAANDSDHVEREAVMAAEERKRIIPVIVRSTKPGPRLSYYVAGRQHFTCEPPPDEGLLDRLAAAILRGAKAVAVDAPRRRGFTAPRPAAIAVGLTLAAALAAALLSLVPDNQSDSATTTSVVDPKPTSSTTSILPELPPSPPSGARGGSRSAGKPEPHTPQPVLEPDGRGAGPPPSPNSPAPRPSTAAPGIAALTVDGASLRFVKIPGGELRKACAAGDDNCQDNGQPARRVVLEPFEMSATEVTQAFWEAVTGENPSDFKGGSSPVEHVSWEEALRLAQRLTSRGDGYRYRLPTEDEWEYAARAGERDSPDLAAVAWFGLAAGSRPPRPQPVASKAANAWGLHDMLGNVAEWCDDWFSPNYQRAVRGGSWVDGPASVSFSARDKAVPSTRNYSIGVRLLRRPT